VNRIISIILILLLAVSAPALGERTIDAEDVTIGGSIVLGRYEQDNDDSNGLEPIEWVVLDAKGSTATLISRYVLDWYVFAYTPHNDACWEDCVLRFFLNSDFVDTAFSEEEKELLLTTVVPARPDSNYDVSAGNDTEDLVYILDTFEAEQLFESDKARIAAPTAWVIAKAAEKRYELDADAADWWVRNPQMTEVPNLNFNAVRSDGMVGGRQYGGQYNTYFLKRLCGVRPVITVQLSGEIQNRVIYPTLQKGDKGDNVVRLQKALIAGGYLTGKADGDFGKGTEAAVKKAQEALGLEATGVADDALQKALYGE